MDSSLVEVFWNTFGGQSGKEFHRAFASRVCFLEWLALYSCVGKSAERWQAMALAFNQVLDGFGGSYVKWTLEEFFADLEERQVVLARWIAEGERAEKTTFRDCLVAVMGMRAQEYFEILKGTGDFATTLMAAGQKIYKQITGVEPVNFFRRQPGRFAQFHRPHCQC
jgi:hypothetical protein